MALILLQKTPPLLWLSQRTQTETTNIREINQGQWKINICFIVCIKGRNKPVIQLHLWNVLWEIRNPMCFLYSPTSLVAISKLLHVLPNLHRKVHKVHLDYAPGWIRITSIMIIHYFIELKLESKRSIYTSSDNTKLRTSSTITGSGQHAREPAKPQMKH